MPRRGLCQRRGLPGPGDRLLAYADGVTEARRDSDIYDEDRSVRTFAGSVPGSARPLVEDVLEDLRAFTDNQIHDDVAILGVVLAHEAAQ